jgi:ankyrin repeat protein
LSRAAETGDMAVIELLLKNGAQPDFEEEQNGRTPLSRAIGGNAAIVELLLAQGVKVDYRYEVVRKFNGSTLVDSD